MIFKKVLSAKVAVIIRTSERPHFLRRAIDDLVQQSYQDWCAIIVNDGPDRTTIDPILTSYPKNVQNKIKTIMLPATIGRGAGLHLNIGIQNTNSTYIAIHDDDDTWSPDFLEKCTSSIGDYAAIVTQSYLVKEEEFNGSFLEKSKEIYEPWQQNGISLFRLAESLTFPPIAMLFKRKIIKTIGAFDDQLGPLEDWDFALRLFSEEAVCFLEEPLANYHKRINGTEKTVNTQEKYQKLYSKLDTSIRNKFLRQDLKTGQMGLGFLLNVAASQGRVLQELLKEK